MISSKTCHNAKSWPKPTSANWAVDSLEGFKWIALKPVERVFTVVTRPDEVGIVLLPIIFPCSAEEP